MDVKLFLPDNVSQVLEFEKSRLPQDLSPIEQEMRGWESSWRKEALSHYSELGWSFVAYNDGELQGYVLAQPFLFFNNWTQSLWVERLSATDSQWAEALMDTVLRWARTKHLQKVLINDQCEVATKFANSLAQAHSGQYLHISTTRMEEAKL